MCRILQVTSKKVKNKNKIVGAQMSIADRLKKLRLALDIAQKPFYEKLGKSEGTANNWESDKRGGSPDGQSLAKIVDLWPQVNIDWLVTGRGEMFGAASVPGGVPQALIDALSVPVVRTHLVATYELFLLQPGVREAIVKHRGTEVKGE
ncbi:MAG: helix-turn-helix transcriptional regulator [bacterium]|nr:helix-turn-helix transcriptional regulator [bacterium]